MDQFDVNQDLLLTVRDLPSDALFSKDSSMDLARVIALGAKEMVAQDRTSESDFELARANLTELIEAMNAERSAMGLKHFSESTVFGARARLCPGLWPFC